MAKESVIYLKVESKFYDDKIKRATEGIKHFEEECRTAGKSLDQADNKTLNYVKALGDMGTVAKTAKGQMREYTNALNDLTSTYRAMSDAEKSSEFGKAMAASIDKIKIKAADLKDQMGDLNAEIKNMASDTQTFDQIAGSVGFMVSAFQVGQGALQMFGVKNEEAVQALAKLQGAMAVTNGLTQIQNALQKQSAVMLGITTVQKKAAAAAEALDTTAKTGNIAVTKAATVAQATLNAVAKANPYVLLATAIIAVGAALFAFCKSSSNAEEEEKKRNEAAQKAIEIENERAQRIAESAGKQVLAYSKLSAEWKNLSTEQERNEWIKNNQNEFNNLGIAVNNVADAENVFVKNTENMVKAFQMRAQAAAYQSMAEEMYTKYIRVKEEYEKHGGDIYAIAMDATKKEADRLLNKSLELQQQAAALIPKTTANPTNTNTRNTRNKPTTTSNKPTTTSNKPKQEEILPDGSIAALEKKISEAKEKFRKATTQDARDAISKDIAEMEQQLSEMKVEPKVELPEGSYAKLKEQLSQLQEQWDLAADDDSRAQIKAQIEEVTAAIKEMEGEVEKVTTATDMWTEHTDKLKDVKDRLAEFQAMMANESLSQEQRDWAKGMAESYQEELNKMLGATEEATTSISDMWKESLDNISSGISAISTIGNAFDNVKKSIEDMSEAFSGEMDAWDALMTVFNSGISIMQTVIGVMDAINTLKEIGAALSKKRALAEATEATATTTAAGTEIAAEGEKVAASATATATNTAEAASGAGKAMSAIPIVGPILAVAAIAAVLAAIMSAKSKAKSAGKFASGGVVGGNSYSGDKLMAYVNSGETILTPQQADRAVAGIQNNPMSNLRLSTEIDGQKLRIVLNNDNRARGGSRTFYSELH